MNLATLNDDDILQMLRDSDGAILGWQCPAEFADAHARGVILFHDDTDSYVHPLANRYTEDGETFGYGFD